MTLASHSPRPRLTTTDLLCYALLLLTAVLPIALNTFAPNLAHARASVLAPATAPADIAPPNPALLLTSRYIVGVSEIFRSARQPLPSHLTDDLSKSAKNPEDRFRALLVKRYLDGPASANPELQKLAAEHPTLAPDVHLFLQQDADATAPLFAPFKPSPELFPPSTPAQLRARHGWFADLAISEDILGHAPHAAALAAATRTAIALLAAILLAAFACFVGLIILIILLVRVAQGKLRPRLPAAHLPFNRRPYLEAFTLYLFLLILAPLLLQLLHLTIPALAITLYFLAPVLAIAWPFLRGQSFAQFRALAGLNTGAGLFREIAAGILGYLAGLPLIAIGAALSLLLIKLSGLDAAHPIQNVISSNPKTIALLFSLACLYAPLFEELTFRGFFYGHLRARHNHLLSALLSSLLFAAIHPQGWPAIPALAAIAFTLATLREYRNSLLPTIAAHALNNTLALTLMTLALS